MTQIYQTLLKSERVLIIPHQNPDGDALGAATALADFLSNHKIPWRIFCATPAPAAFNYLPHIDKLTTDPALWKNEQFSTIVDVDSGDLVYAGVADYIAALPRRPLLINIDHHPTNQFYGDLNLVLPTASSTNEILYRFFTYNREPITAKMATALMTGLLTDTGTFTNAGTTRLALSVGSELLKKGANWPLIKEFVMRDKSVAKLKLWGTVLSRLTLDPATEIVYTFITQADYATHHTGENGTEGMANLLNYLSEGRAALVLEERPDSTIKGSFRTTRPDVNVALWAKQFGGGGHVKAAGFKVPGPLDDAIKRILAKVQATAHE